MLNEWHALSINEMVETLAVNPRRAAYENGKSFLNLSTNTWPRSTRAAIKNIWCS